MDSLPNAVPRPFLSGVIEGFYGPPWSPAERSRLWDWMAGCGLNTYLYGPKDDLHQRAIWRQPYGESGLAEVQGAVSGCRARGLRLVYACSPGLDVTYADPSDLAAMKARLEQLIAAGARQMQRVAVGVNESARVDVGHRLLRACGSAIVLLASTVGESSSISRTS